MKKTFVIVMCDRVTKAGPYASLAVGRGAERRVITVPKEVIRLLVVKFKLWMGYEREV